MKRLNVGLASLAAGLALLHAAYSLHSERNVLQGVYFSKGVTVASNGESYPMGMRIQAHDQQVHNFEQISNQGQKFSFSLVRSLWGNARFVTSATSSALVDRFALTDRDLMFNYAYLSGLMSALTFYRLNVDSNSPCFYVRELERVLCFGRERNKKQE